MQSHSMVKPKPAFTTMTRSSTDSQIVDTTSISLPSSPARSSTAALPEPVVAKKTLDGLVDASGALTPTGKLTLEVMDATAGGVSSTESKLLGAIMTFTYQLKASNDENKVLKAEIERIRKENAHIAEAYEANSEHTKDLAGQLTYYRPFEEYSIHQKELISQYKRTINDLKNDIEQLKQQQMAEENEAVRLLSEKNRRLHKQNKELGRLVAQLQAASQALISTEPNTPRSSASSPISPRFNTQASPLLTLCLHNTRSQQSSQLTEEEQLAVDTNRTLTG